MILGGMALSVGLIGLLLGCSKRSSSKKRRHARKQVQARRVLNKLREIQHGGQKLSYLRKIDPLVFEELVLEALVQRGVTVTRSESYSGDGGIDGRFMMGNGKRYLVQCKRYEGYVSKQHILEFASILESKGIHGIFCHTGKTGRASLDFHKEHEYLTIVSGENLLRLLSI